MLRIGEFSGLTGLSVKALRHYNETGAIVPASVADWSAYRMYCESQVRAGVEISMLREAGVPLPAVSAAVEAGEAGRALEAHRVRVLEQREREDRVFCEAANVLRALTEPIVVSERSIPAQHFVGQVIAIPDYDDAADLDDDYAADSDEESNAGLALGALFERLQAAGVISSGPVWSALQMGNRGSGVMMCCWPTDSEVPEQVRGSESFSAVLPARTELVATWRPPTGEEFPDETQYALLIGLLDAAAKRGTEIGNIEVRQMSGGQSAGDHAIEMSVTVS